MKKGFLEVYLTLLSKRHILPSKRSLWSIQHSQGGQARTYHSQPMMYRATALFHWSAVWTSSQENPITIAMTVRTINMFGLHVPKSADISFTAWKATKMLSNAIPAKLPSNKNTTTCIENEMPLQRRTILLIVRSLSSSSAPRFPSRTLSPS